MKLDVKELIKLILNRENITQTELANLLTEKTGNKYRQDSLSRKLNRGTMTYNEAIMIAEVLGYELELKKIS